MSLDEHNLNIHMYSLDEVLSLFNLTYDISHEDLKRAKKTVLMTHPDKSKLKSEYFLFYKQAFDIIVKFYDNQNKQKQSINPQNTVYSTDNQDNSKQISSAINDINKKEFHSQFNNLFEKNMVKQIDTTRNEWFKNDESRFNTNVQVNSSNMGQVFNTFKDQQTGIVKYRGVQNLTSNTGSNNYYDDDDDSYVISDPFSKLKFDDLRKVHKDETVFSVSERDYKNIPKYSSVDHFVRERGKQSTAPMEQVEAERMLAQQDKTYRTKMMKKEYNSNLQTMEYSEKNKNILSKFLQIKN